ncbi:hypothetical protein ACUN0C_12980 [Faunimonas sp. B44]|uniref:hypothetical protein n=1 Tax=Faunimonas sp. B44 TaxID=3461493 RepID=UPI004044306C
MTTRDLRPDLSEALERFGADLSRWPDERLAREADAALACDPALRAEWEAWRDLDGRLDATRAACDRSITRSAAVARLRANALAATTRRLRWPVAAAAVVAGLVVGGVLDLAIAPPAPRGTEIVLLDSLVFGPDEVDLR